MRSRVVRSMFVVVLAASLVAGGCAAGSGARPAGLPQGFPADVPVYAATVVRAETTPVSGSNIYLVSLETPDSMDAVSAWYTEQMKAGGWKVVTPPKPSTTGSFMMATKGGTRLSVTLATGSDKAGKPLTAIAESVTFQ